MTGRQCLTCGEFEGSPWVTAKCEFEARSAEPAYVPVVREWPHGFYAGAQKVGASRPGVLCRHMHKTRRSAEKCAEQAVARRSVAR